MSMDFRIEIVSGASGQQSAGQQAAGTPTPLPAPTPLELPPLPGGTTPTAPPSPTTLDQVQNSLDPIGQQLKRMLAGAGRQSQGVQQGATATEDDTPTRIAEQLKEEQRLRAKRLEEMRERYRQDSAASQAARQNEEEKLLRQRQLEVLKERNRIDGAAAEEAAAMLATQREMKDWQNRVNEERRKQDPGAAQAEDMAGLGSILGQLTGGQGLGGTLSRLLQMGPQFQQQFSGLFGQPSTAAPSAPAAPAAAQPSPPQPLQLPQLPTSQPATPARPPAASAPPAPPRTTPPPPPPPIRPPVSPAASAAPAAGGAGAGAARAATAAAGSAGGAGAAAGAAGGAGGLAAAAGPVGLAIAAADMIATQQANQIKQSSESIRGFGEQIQRLNRNDHLGAFVAGVGGAAKTLEGIPIVGKVAAAQLERFGTAVKTAGDVLQSFVDRGQQLAKYSGELSVAQARSDVRSTMSDIKEASELGPVLARLTENQSEIGDMLRELSLPVKEIIAEGMSLVVDLVKELVGFLRDINESTGFLKGAKDLILAILAKLREWLGAQVSTKADGRTLDDLIERNFGSGLDPRGTGELIRSARRDFGTNVPNAPLPNGGF